MSDDFQRDALAPLMCPRHDCESTRHALNQLRVENKHLRAEIERLQRERDALFRTACRLAPRDAVRTTDATLNAGLDQLRAIANGQVLKISPLQASLVLDYVRALAAKVASYERADRVDEVLKERESR